MAAMTVTAATVCHAGLFRGPDLTRKASGDLIHSNQQLNQFTGFNLIVARLAQR